MSKSRTLAGLFAAASLALLSLVPSGLGTGGPLFAQADTSSCGGYNSPLCKTTQSCAGWFLGKVCTTTYYYWPPNDGGGGGPDDPAELDPN